MSDNHQTTPILEAFDLGRRGTTDRQWILRHAAMTVCGGDRLIVQGPSGSGKTVLLRSLSLLDPVDEGTIQWHNRPIVAEQIPSFRSRVVYVHQRACLSEGTVEDVLRLPLTYRVHRGRRFGRQRMVAWLKTLGRDASFLGKSTQDLSGGEAQIVAILRVIQLDPELLLLDEPTAALDQRATEAVERLIMAWYHEQPAQRAFVAVTHDSEQAKRLGDRVVHIQDGILNTAE